MSQPDISLYDTALLILTNLHGVVEFHLMELDLGNHVCSKTE